MATHRLVRTSHSVPTRTGRSSCRTSIGIDLLSHFDRERIPERVVHAKGSGAHGFFECTDPIPELTRADILSAKGNKCPVTVCFSTVGGESGSHDLARDPRGFAVKMRTGEGNWDIAANNTPIFFLRDPPSFLTLSTPKNAIQARD